MSIRVSRSFAGGRTRPRGPVGALEYGLRARRARRSATVSGSHRGRSVESPESCARGVRELLRPHCRCGPGTWMRGIARLQSITVNHGTEFTARALEDWAYYRGVQLDFIRPGKPVENASVAEASCPCGHPTCSSLPPFVHTSIDCSPRVAVAQRLCVLQGAPHC
jgi:hypothetical protein